MNDLIWYLPAAYIWCYIGSKVPLSLAVMRANNGRYDNKTPRNQQDALTGQGARLRAAHYNAIESFPPFAAAVLVASIADQVTLLMQSCAIVWCGSRLAYQWAYAADQGTLRTIIWGFSVLANLGLFCSLLV